MDKYSDLGFIVIGLPNNQFSLEEPGRNDEILAGIKFVRPGGGFEPNFPIFAKLDVNGENEHPLYTHLKSSCPPVKQDIGNPADFYWTPIRPNDLTWNFNKFLVDHQGVPYKRYDSTIEPENIQDDIDFLLTRRSRRYMERSWRKALEEVVEELYH